MRTFTTPGTFRYYCQVHGGPNGVGMSGTVTVNPTGYPRPKGASPLRASLAPAYKPCTASNRTHGAPLSFASCSPPVQVSNYVTVGSPDANGAAASSVGSVTLKVLSPADVRFVSSITDVRKKSDLTDYTGELQAKLPIQITDKLNGPSVNENGTGNTTIALRDPLHGHRLDHGRIDLLDHDDRQLDHARRGRGRRASGLGASRHPGLRRRGRRRRLDDRRQHPVRGSGGLRPVARHARAVTVRWARITAVTFGVRPATPLRRPRANPLPARFSNPRSPTAGAAPPRRRPARGARRASAKCRSPRPACHTPRPRSARRRLRG